MVSPNGSGSAFSYPNRDVSVDVFMACLNTAASTELCIRSMRAMAGRPFHLGVGDCGSDDGSIELLRNLESKGWLSLEVAPNGRQHWEWLDQWTETSKADYAIFVDSDVEFRRTGWLCDLVDAAVSSEATLVAAEFCAETPGFVEPVRGRTVRLAGRPAPWLMLIDPSAVAQLGRSFKAEVVEGAEVPEGVQVFDTGGAVYESVIASGLRCSIMPPEFADAYRHYRGLSWSPLSARVGINRHIVAVTIWRRLRALRNSQGT
jgi:hypothetical protein